MGNNSKKVAASTLMALHRQAKDNIHHSKTVATLAPMATALNSSRVTDGRLRRHRQETMVFRAEVEARPRRLRGGHEFDVKDRACTGIQQWIDFDYGIERASEQANT